MEGDAVIDWDAVFKKGARSKDDVQVGTVVGTTDENVSIEWGSRLVYDVPKDNVEGFDGNEIFLNLSREELARFERRV
jgi:hypothetical protein